ncbi:MAG: bacterial Ig-like domain [Actinomycetia bacterium]|nr:bacterial Ig-like domain [Actinomycetes bacterium]
MSVWWRTVGRRQIRSSRATIFVATTVALAVGVAGCATKSAGRLSGADSTTTPTTRAANAAPPPVQLLAADGVANDNFGGALWFNTFQKPLKSYYYATPGEAALSSDGTVALVGAPAHADAGKTGAGAAYVFTSKAGKWSQVAQLVPADASAYAGFGWSVAMSGDGHDVVIGAPYTDRGANVDIGAAYFFHEVAGKWSQVAAIRGADSAAYDGFGWSVALSRDGSTAMVGATGHTSGGVKKQGAAYVFRKRGTAWAEVRQLAPKVGHPNAEFGGWVALSADGSTAAVTKLSHLDAQKTYFNGGTYLFGTSDGWKKSEQLALFEDPKPNTDGTSDQYGVNVALSDDGKVAAVAAPDLNIGAAGGAGATYVYTTTTDWRSAAANTARTLLPSFPVNFGYYGSSVALSADGSLLFIGIDGVGSNGQGAGELVRLTRASANAASNAAAKPTTTAINAPNTEKGRFGTAVAMSADGSTVLATAPWLTIKGAATRGAAYVLTLPVQSTQP